jgi:UDP-N-acetyl-alpha-D-muramoyl-L-alanyl-L-glutamate epimerase
MKLTAIGRGTFRFLKSEFRIDPQGFGSAELHYQISADGFAYSFMETVQFPGAPKPLELSPQRQAACARALQILHVIAGVSYFKATNAPRFEFCEGAALDPALAELANAVYTHGLAEFCYQNATEVRARFVPNAPEIPPAPPLDLAPRALVAIGGGKDSLVSIEALKKGEIPACAVWIGNSELIQGAANATGLATLNIQRAVSPELFALNSEGALNGHVPVTAINSAILLLAATLYGYRDIVFSNEASANAATLMHQGKAVNHQWSKSAAFEHAFAALVRHSVAPNLHYFSLLRPYRELAITAKFAKFHQYDHVFSSCNRNFKILGAKPAARWCAQCPKCHFVFLALAPFVPKPRLLAIFGRNVLDEPDLAPNFDALIEWQGAHKPFECVGEAQESTAAFIALSNRADWQEDTLIARFAREIRPHLPAQLPDISDLCQADTAALLAPEFRDLVARL